jgi:adenylate cyclase
MPMPDHAEEAEPERKHSMGDADRDPNRASDPAHAGAAGDDRAPMLMTAVKLARELLPGDSRYGDPLSTAGSQPRALVGRRLGDLAQRRPSILKEAGLGALQVMEAVAGTASGEAADPQRAIVFTDLVGFSSWALKAGDEAAVELLRDVGEAIEPPVTESGGVVVKRLGDGMMAAFDDAPPALAAVLEAGRRLEGIAARGYRPRMRAGIHLGTPKPLGADYFGIDVNVAARVAEEAAAGEILVSGQALGALAGEVEAGRVKARRKLLFRAKGVPGDVTVYSVKEIA